MIRHLYLLSMLLTFAPISFSYELTTQHHSAVSESNFRTQNGAPLISEFTSDNCESNCSVYVKIDNKTFRFNHTAYIVSTARYSNKSFAVVSQSQIDGNGELVSSQNEYYFIDGQKKIKRVDNPLCSSAISSSITSDGRWVCLGHTSIEIHSNTTSIKYKLPTNAKLGIINNNLDGELAVAIVSIATKQLYYANLRAIEAQGDTAWQATPIFLHNRSDLRNIIATYPTGNDSGVVALYEYINVFNKGVNLYKFDHSGVNYRVVTNNEVDNWGQSPQVFKAADQYIITAQSKFNSNRKSYSVNESEMSHQETYVNNHSDTSQFDFLAGYGIQYNNWEAWQSVGDYVKTEYVIESSLLHSVYMQARMRDTQLSLEYLKNIAEEKSDDDVGESIDFLTGLVDFNAFFSGADTLRLKVDWLKSSGTATYKASSRDYCVEGLCQISKGFSSEYIAVDTLVFSEGGSFIGLSFSNYAIPSAIGLQTATESMRGITFDEHYEQNKLMFVAGKDAAAYAARYELDYSAFYFLPIVGIGAVQHKISDDAIERALDGSNKDVIGEFALALTGTLDAGYIFQRRWLESRGLGFSLQAGIKAKYDWVMGAPFTSDSHLDYEIAYERSDLWWGPYLQGNLIF